MMFAAFFVGVTLLCITFTLTSSATVQPITTISLQPDVRFKRGDPIALGKCASAAVLPTATTTITVDDTIQYQPIQGFGAALTEATAYNLLQLRNRSISEYNDVLHRLFSEYKISVMRLPISSSDMSPAPAPWSMDDTVNDTNLTHFNLDRFHLYVIPVLKDILKINPKMKLNLTPWSAPAWMKDSMQFGSGTLQPRYYELYATFWMKIVMALRAENIPVWAITIQNEPQFEPGSYPGMRMSALNESHMAELLAPFMHHNSGGYVKIIGYDHNWDTPQYPLELLSLPGGKHIDAIAWHCYGGDVSAQGQVHQKFPNMSVYFTECTGTGSERSVNDFEGSFEYNLRDLYFGNIHNWGQLTTHWNIATNSLYQPHTGGCGTCRGIITIDAWNTSVPTSVTYHSEMFTIAHFALATDSIRIDSTILDPVPKNIDVLAFQNQTHNIIQIVNYNDNDITIQVKDIASNQCFQTSMIAHSLTSFVYDIPVMHTSQMKTAWF